MFSFFFFKNSFFFFILSKISVFVEYSTILRIYDLIVNVCVYLLYIFIIVVCIIEFEVIKTNTLLRILHVLLLFLLLLFISFLFGFFLAKIMLRLDVFSSKLFLELIGDLYSELNIKFSQNSIKLK